MENSNKICYWRELWRLTSGFTPSDLITVKLKGIQNQLENGLCFFKPTSSESYQKFVSSHSTFSKVFPFMEKLHKFMGLDTEQCWDIFCHYLSSQYHGTPEIALQNFTFMDVRMNQLLLDVWIFYNSERMFMLKQLKLMLEYKNSKHIYKKEFSSMIDSITLNKLKNSLIKQFEYLVNETPPSKLVNGDMVTFQMQKLWIERNLREQVEVLLLILLVVEEKDLTIPEFKKLFTIFKIHNFGRQPLYSKYLEEANMPMVMKIVYSEVALFYKIVNDSISLNVQTIIKNIKDDIEGELIRLQQNEEHGALLLAWMLLLLQEPDCGEIFITQYQQYGNKALRLRVFEFLHKMISHEMFSDKSKCAIIVRKSVFQMLQTMCDKFDADGSVAMHNHVIELCAELLTDEDLAASFWSSANNYEAPGVISLWNTALEFFPYDFKTLSLFIIGLSKAGSENLQCLFKELEILPVYTELYKPGMVRVCNVMDEEDSVLLTEEYCPYGDRSLLIKNKSSAAIMDRRNVTLIHFRTPTSYWRVLQNEIQDLINSSFQGNANIFEKMERVLWGIKALVAVLNQMTPGEPLPESLVGPCEAVFEVLVRFANSEMPLPPLIAACLNVSTALVPNFTEKIYIRLMNIKLLPTIEFMNLSHEEYANGLSFQSSILGSYLINVEQPNGEYCILNSYLDLLFAFYECNYDRDISKGVLLPGLVFILREVFPHMSEWFFKTPFMKHNLTLKCVNYLLKISQLSPEQTTRPADLLLNKTCVFSLLNLNNGMALLKLISLGEQNIQSVMENETNWLTGPGIDYIKMVQISMAVLMQVLRLKSLVQDKNSLGPLEHLIYTQPKQKNALKIVPVVAGYINHVFNPQLPNTACRLLRRFALEFQMSLLICLDMSPHQIRIMFLERLRDESESSSLKTVILEFVAACVEKQPGLTEAFFKVSHPQDEKRLFHNDKSTDCTDGILTYMAEYLSAVKNNTNSLYSPLLSRIMGLFHALWKNNMQILVKDLRENPDFWEYLCSPLFQDILPDIRAYSQIFNMVAIELFLFQGKIDKSLKSALEKLFSSDGKHLRNWVKYIFSFDGRKSALKVIDEVPGWLSLLTSWKDFVSIIIKFLPFKISLTNKNIMVEMCLNTLNKEMEHMDDGRTIVILSEMYVIFFSHWKEDCFEDRHKYFKQVSTLLNHTAAGFEDLHLRAKNSILAISTLSLNMLSYDCKSEKELSNEIIRAVCTISSTQLDKIFTNDKECPDKTLNSSLQSVSDNEKLNPIVLGLRLLEQCINVFKESFIGWHHWFISMRLINKLVYFVSMSVRKKSMLKQTLAAFNCLTAFARSSVSQDILHCDISHHLWLQLLPPKELSQTNPTKQPDANHWLVNEWLQVYKSAIEFVTAMLENHGNFFSSDAILFVGVQEDYLNESISLIRQSLDMDVLNLINSTLYFVSELVKYENQWRQEHYQSMAALMRSISVCFHYCVTMVLRPRGIHLSVESPSTLLTQDDTDNAGPSTKVTVTLNKLLELMHLSAVCLKAFSPDLLTLLADPCPDVTKWQPLMELQFSAPKLTDDPYPQLTFGTVMSAVCFLTRSLNHNYHPDETPLNSIRRQPGRRGSSRRRISGGLGEDSLRRRTLRSDSVTSLSSTTSTVIIGPSWLAALDKRLVLLTLENILTLLASQSLLAAKDMSMSSRDKQVIKRELCTELPIFHDFVRKKVLDLSHPKNYLSRKKFGSYPLLKNEDESKVLTSAQESQQEIESMDSTAIPPPPPPQRLSYDSMRVSVVRKLHLDKARTKLSDSASTPKKFIPLDQYSPIHPSTSDQTRNLALTSTPSGSTSKILAGSSRTSKHVTWEDTMTVEEEEEEELLDPVDPEYSTLSEVQIIEEDYFHFLSNLFLYLCQTDI